MVQSKLNTVFKVNKYSDFAARLSECFEQEVNRLPDVTSPHVKEIFNWVLNEAKGSWHRPKLIYALSPYGEVDLDKAVYLATVAEMIHCATLLHDDVIDHGLIRRNKPTANALYGNANAVLSGDVLLARSLEILLEHRPQAISNAIHAISDLAVSAQNENMLLGKVSTGFHEWKDIAKRKTGSLIGFCLAGLYPAEKRKELFQLGYDLGVFFQLCDDIKDFQPSVSGKPSLQDLRNGNPNWVIIHSLQKNIRLQDRLEKFWSTDQSSSDTGILLSQFDMTSDIQSAMEQVNTLFDQLRINLLKQLGPNGQLPILTWLQSIYGSLQQDRAIAK